MATVGLKTVLYDRSIKISNTCDQHTFAHSGSVVNHKGSDIFIVRHIEVVWLELSETVVLGTTRSLYEPLKRSGAPCFTRVSLLWIPALPRARV